jgi:hypothetical protein
MSGSVSGGKKQSTPVDQELSRRMSGRGVKHRVDNLTCPSCGKTVNSAIQARTMLGEDTPQPPSGPKDGDFNVCSGCAGVGVVVEVRGTLWLRGLQGDELLGLLSDDPLATSTRRAVEHILGLINMSEAGRK